MIELYPEVEVAIVCGGYVVTVARPVMGEDAAEPLVSCTEVTCHTFASLPTLLQFLQTTLQGWEPSASCEPVEKELHRRKGDGGGEKARLT